MPKKTPKKRRYRCRVDPKVDLEVIYCPGDMVIHKRSGPDHDVVLKPKTAVQLVNDILEWQGFKHLIEVVISEKPIIVPQPAKIEVVGTSDRKSSGIKAIKRKAAAKLRKLSR